MNKILFRIMIPFLGLLLPIFAQAVIVHNPNLEERRLQSISHILENGWGNVCVAIAKIGDQLYFSTNKHSESTANLVLSLPELILKLKEPLYHIDKLDLIVAGQPVTLQSIFEAYFHDGDGEVDGKIEVSSESEGDKRWERANHYLTQVHVAFSNQVQIKQFRNQFDSNWIDGIAGSYEKSLELFKLLLFELFYEYSIEYQNADFNEYMIYMNVHGIKSGYYSNLLRGRMLMTSDQLEESAVEIPGVTDVKLSRDPGIHAELKLVLYLYTHGLLNQGNAVQRPYAYIAVSKLCCEDCYHFLEHQLVSDKLPVLDVNFFEGSEHRVPVRIWGRSTTAWAKWIYPLRHEAVAKKIKKVSGVPTPVFHDLTHSAQNRSNRPTERPNRSQLTPVKTPVKDRKDYQATSAIKRRKLLLGPP